MISVGVDVLNKFDWESLGGGTDHLATGPGPPFPKFYAKTRYLDAWRGRGRGRKAGF